MTPLDPDQVLAQLGFGGEWLAAEETSPWVLSASVPLEVCTSGKPPITAFLGAIVGLLTGVSSNVIREMVRLRKGPVTRIADERFLPGVYPNVDRAVRAR